MSRIGNKVIQVPAGVTVNIGEQTITLKDLKENLNLSLMKT